MSKFLEEGSIALEIKEEKKLTNKIFSLFFFGPGGPKIFFPLGRGPKPPWVRPWSLIIAKLPLAN